MKITEGLTYDDISLKPKYSEIPNRDEKNVSLLCSLGSHSMRLPVISSPMDTVTESDMVIAMQNHGGLGIVHRFNTIEEQVDIVSESDAQAAAIGMTGDYLERTHALLENGVKILCIDTAHGHHSHMKTAIQVLKRRYGNEVHIMAGSISTADAAQDLSRWGADSLRVGIGGGSICSTRLQTGFGTPNLTAIIDAKRGVGQAQYMGLARNVKIIADGGIRQSGDMLKAFAAGADFVMLGSMLAGTTETPGIVHQSGNGFSRGRKVYRGMASRQVQKERGSTSAPEGISVDIPYKGGVDKVLEPIPGWIRSGFSYVGARNIIEFRERVEAYKQTRAGVLEGHTHIEYVK